jgi:hypothetical protein
MRDYDLAKAFYRRAGRVVFGRHQHAVKLIEELHAFPLVVKVREVLKHVGTVCFANAGVLERPRCFAQIVLDDFIVTEGDGVHADEAFARVWAAAKVQTDESGGFFYHCVHLFHHVKSTTPNAPDKSWCPTFTPQSIAQRYPCFLASPHITRS